MSIKLSKRETAKRGGLPHNCDSFGKKIRRVTRLSCPYDWGLIRRPGLDNLPVIQYVKGVLTVSVLLTITQTFLRVNNCWGAQ